MHVELEEYFSQVDLHRIDFNLEMLGDFSVTHPLENLFHDVLLTAGEGESSDARPHKFFIGTISWRRVKTLQKAVLRPIVPSALMIRFA